MLGLRETIDCPCCEESQHREWAQENGFTAVKCADCGAVYVRDRPPADTVSAAARDGVHETEAGSLDQRYGRRGWKVPYYSRIIRRFFGRDEALTWLDVGAGYGELIEAVHRALPESSAMGIDPMRVKVRAARDRRLPVEEKTLEEVAGQYDVVSLINVFSHIPDFNAFAEQIKKIIKPGGSLFLETGNGGDLASRRDYPGDLLLPDHLVFAGVDQMKRLLTGLGFVEVEHYSRRTDHPLWAAKQAAKGLLRGRLEINIPYTKPFRTVFYRARLPR